MLEQIFQTQVPVIAIMGRSAVIYLAILIGLRIAGKRQISQMTPFDLILILLISNAVQNAMVGPDTSLTGGVVAAATLIAMSSVFLFLIHRVGWMGRWFEGTPTLLINNGKVVDTHLHKENISYDELLQALREHGVADPMEVSTAILEVDGSISVIKRDDVAKEYTSKKRFRQFKHHWG